MPSPRRLSSGCLCHKQIAVLEIGVEPTAHLSPVLEKGVSASARAVGKLAAWQMHRRGCLAGGTAHSGWQGTFQGFATQPNFTGLR